jgi:DNA mismatch repair protein MutS
LLEASHVITQNETKRKTKHESKDRHVTGQAQLHFPDKPHPVVEAIENLAPDELSPRQALDLIYTLKRLSQS